MEQETVQSGGGSSYGKTIEFTEEQQEEAAAIQKLLLPDDIVYEPGTVPEGYVPGDRILTGVHSGSNSRHLLARAYQDGLVERVRVRVGPRSIVYWYRRPRAEPDGDAA